jgi:GTP cyclohydrolase I
MYEELLIGYSKKPDEILSKVFPASSKDMVIVKNIWFVSLCAHHWLPFIGHCTIGYIPKEKIVGLSKIPRLVHCFARRFQVQEDMTSQIADALYDSPLQPQGCIVVTKAKHLCSEIRGVQTRNSNMIVSAIRGCFEDKTVRQEFFNLVQINNDGVQNG